VTFTIEIVLRDTENAVTEHASQPDAPANWTDEDVRDVLKQILTAIDRARNPDALPRQVTLRGFSWIVEPCDPSTLRQAQGRPEHGRRATGSGSSPAQSRAEDQVVIAIEIPTGAAVAGPFVIEEARLTAMIARALGREASPPVH
jgi:hypothetical protein